MRGIVKIAIFTLLLAGAIRPAAASQLPYTKGHMDIGVRYDSVNNVLIGYWKNDGATVNNQVTVQDYAANEIRALAIFDDATPPPVRPAGSQWNFLGVAAGEPVYILPSTGVPDTIPYLGFSTEHPSVAAFDDPITITLTGMTGPSGGVFSLYTTSANVPMNTLSSTFPAGQIEVDIGDHLHFNWAFSQMGTYDLTFSFSGFLNGDEFFGSDTFRFQIIPEPSAAWLLLAGAALLAWRKSSNRRHVREQ